MTKENKENKEIKFSDNLIKKIIQIKKDEYLLEVKNNAVLTTYNKEDALDISNWKLEQLGYIISNLNKVGYNKAKVLTIFETNDDENKEKDNE